MPHRKPLVPFLTVCPVQWSASLDSLLLSCDINRVQQLAVAAADSGHYHVWDVRSGQKINSIKGIISLAALFFIQYT